MANNSQNQGHQGNDQRRNEPNQEGRADLSVAASATMTWAGKPASVPATIATNAVRMTTIAPGKITRAVATSSATAGLSSALIDQGRVILRSRALDCIRRITLS